MSPAARLRDLVVLKEQIGELACDIAEHRGDPVVDFQQGAMVALRWVTRGGPAPLTGCFDDAPISVQAIVRELAAAEAVICGRQSRHRTYCTGTEHALMWAQFATASPPLRQLLSKHNY